MSVATSEKAASSSASNGIRAERDRFAALSFCWADVLMELDDNHNVIFGVGAVQPLTGHKPQDFMGMNLMDLVSDRDKPLVKGLLAVAAKKGRIENIIIRLKAKSGKDVHVQLAGYKLADLKGHYFLAMRKAPPKVGAGEHGRPLKDAESGLYNAESFGNVLKKRLKNMDSDDVDSQMTLIELGDYEALKGRLDSETEQDLVNTVGACLRANSVDGDSAARIDDDKYGLVHGDDIDVEELKKQIAEVAKALDPEGKGVEVGAASVDVSDDATNKEDLANGLVYAINRFKSSKGEEFSIHNLSSQLNDLVHEASDTVTNFKRIVEKMDFEAAFQPIVDAQTKKLHHYEALVRFDMEKEAHATSPYETITMAEETGMIPEFDLAMAKKVIQRLQETPINSNISVAVNVSGNSVGSEFYVKGLRKLLEENPWTRGRLMFEITESSRMGDLDIAAKFIDELREGGYEVCLDDFGAGAANFEYLSKLEVDVVKIDGPVVRNAFNGYKGKAFMKALVNLCRDLGVETIAEMIDSQPMLDFVRECGVEYVQGYYLGKPGFSLQGYGKK